MSMDPIAIVYYGTFIKSDTVREKKKIKKYDENTGKPYIKIEDNFSVKHPSWVTELLKERAEAYNLAEEIKMPIKIEPLNEDESEVLVGVEITTLSFNDDTISEFLNVKPKDKERVDKFLTEHGVPKNKIGFVLGTIWR